MAPKRLSRRSYAAIERSDSCVSVWEMLIKQESGRLVLPREPLAEAIQAHSFRLLPLKLEHVQAAADLRALQGDLNDRMIVGTARAEGMVLVTRDVAILERAAPLLGDLLMEA